MKLNLGCGGDLRKGYLNIDIQIPSKGSKTGENLRTKNLLDFPHLKMMLEEQSLIVQKYWHEGKGLNIDCQKMIKIQSKWKEAWDNKKSILSL